MSWSRRFRFREYVRGSLWLIPLAGAVIGGLLGTGIAQVDRSVNLPGYWTYSDSTASTVLAAIVGAEAALTGFVVTVTVLVVQMATGTFSARYMRLWYRDGMLKVTLAVLAGTLTFSFGLLRRIESDFVPNLGVTIAGALVVLGLILFLVFFDRFIHRLRPVAVAALVGKAGREAFEDAVRMADRPDIRWDPYEPARDPTLTVRCPRGGSIQAIHADGLVVWAREHDADLVLVHAVGDFVPTGVPLIRVYGDVGEATAAERELQGMVALGDERTLQQDPAFAMRIIVDIADKALSPAVNDPTTAVQALNHLSELLRLIGTTDLERRERSAAGETPTRVVMRARSWEDFLALGVTEIREYGASSIQVLRRLRAVLVELHETVRPEFRAAVDAELVRLDATVAAHWGDSVDLDRAEVSDRQGIGGPGVAGSSS
jgi:uncharacterized membrane protein